MASKMSLQSDMLSFPLISRPITALIKRKSIQVNFNLIRTKYIFYNICIYMRKILNRLLIQNEEELFRNTQHHIMVPSHLATQSSGYE